MALRTEEGYHYGDCQEDVREALIAYSADGDLAEHFADAVCACGGRLFRLELDENEGVAVRTCTACAATHPIGDSDEFLEEAELEECECACGGEEFEITVGVALYPESDAVKWLFIGCRCPACGLAGCWGDWKNEYEPFSELLARV
jgi:hypothetical protein